MSNFLILSEVGDGCGLALRLQAEGHKCRVWIAESDVERRSGVEGLVEETDDITFGDIVIADSVGFGDLCDMFREGGRLVFGGSRLHDRLENDREYAKGIMDEVGIPTPKGTYFKGERSWEDARELISGGSATDSRYAFKPGGRLSGVVPSYVSADADDMILMLDFYKTKFGASEAEFEIQDFIEGIAVSTEGWFDGTDFVRPFNHTIERKQLMNGDVGPSGGCTGNLVWIVDDEDDPLVVELLKMKPFLKEHRYVGPIDLNAVVGESGIFALEFTPRFGYDAFPTYLYGLFAGDFGGFVSDMVRGRARMDLVDSFAAGIRITIPPWPSEDSYAKVGVPIRGWTSNDLKMVYPYDVKLQGDMLVSSGGWGAIGVANGVDDSISGAFAKAQKLCEKVKIANKQYRTDLAECCASDYRKIGSLLKEMV
jgi:phosphoribosylamine---glycine ligase